VSNFSLNFQRLLTSTLNFPLQEIPVPIEGNTKSYTPIARSCGIVSSHSAGVN
jgi:hypothetical protein